MYMQLSGEIYDVDDMINNMTINFKNTLDKHKPLKQKKSKHRSLIGWFNENIRNLISERNLAKQRGSYGKYKELRNKVTNIIKQERHVIIRILYLAVRGNKSLQTQKK